MARRRKATATTASPSGEAVTSIRYSATDTAITDRLSELLATARQRPLSEEEAALRRHEPWLEWSGDASKVQ